MRAIEYNTFKGALESALAILRVVHDATHHITTRSTLLRNVSARFQNAKFTTKKR
jgi:hypothetical protein